MILIAHRGNINGRIPEMENKLEYINGALSKGYDVEIDVWYVNNKFYLGHDEPLYEVQEWFLARHRLWCHAKNYQAMEMMLKNINIHCFWHQNDDRVLTSRAYVWTYPGKILIENSIACLPEVLTFENIDKAIGICSDYISKYNLH